MVFLYPSARSRNLATFDVTNRRAPADNAKGRRSPTPKTTLEATLQNS